MKQLRAVVYSGKVGAKPTKLRYTVGSKKIHKHKYLCENGPWRGTILYLESAHTLTMTIKGETGRYIGGIWKCTSPQT